MTKKELAVIGILGILAIIQVSFVPHFKILAVEWSRWINFIDTAVIVIAFFERRRGRLGWIAALSGGIFLDLFSGRFFGFWIALLLAAVGFIKMVLKKYVRIPSFW